MSIFSLLNKKGNENSTKSRILTVLFSDIRNFTGLSEDLSIKQLKAFIDNYLDVFGDIVYENDGKLDKFMGDGIFAYWNAPKYDEHHREKALRASSQMFESLQLVVDRTDGVDHMDIGVGINTGEMLIGTTKGGEKLEFTIFGDNVNLAKRLEGLTKKYGVKTLISENTFNDGFDSTFSYTFRLIDEVIVKGRHTPVKIFEPILKTGPNMNLKVNYENGFSLYQKGNFQKAYEIFSNMAADSASAVMATRIAKLKSVGREWNGIWKWNEK